MPREIRKEVEAHLGKAFVENHYPHRFIGTGKPALSGWERKKLGRERGSRDWVSSRLELG